METLIQQDNSDNTTSNLSREEKIKQYLEKDIHGSKSTFCRFYRRGCCIFSAKDCKHAHSIKDLQFNKLDLQEFLKQGKTSETSESQPKAKGKDSNDGEDNDEEGYVEKKNGKQPALGLELTYHGLYEYQLALKERGEVDKIYTEDDINNNNVIRRELRKRLQNEIQQEFVDFLLVEYNTKALKKSFIEKCFSSVDWMAHWKYIFSNFYGYEVKSMITKQPQGEEFDEYMEDSIVKIIKDKDLLQKLPISPAIITKLYYQYIGSTNPLMPSHQLYLKYRDIKSMDDYLGSLQTSEKFLTKLASACGKEADDLFGKLFDHTNNEMQALIDQIKAVLIELVERSNIGLILYARFETKVMQDCTQGLKQFNNNLPQIKRLMTKMVMQEKMLLVNLGSDLYIFSPARFKKVNINEIKEKYHEKLFRACSLPPSDHLASDEFPPLREEELKREVPHRQTEEFLEEELAWDKIVVVDSEKTLQAAREHFANIDAIGVDLEGNLAKNGRLWLVQVGSKEKIFVFDVYKVKKMAREDEKYVNLYNDMASLLKELAEDSKICKIFHDGRKDSLGFHVFLDACPANTFDLSALYMMIEHLERYRAQKINTKENSSKEVDSKEGSKGEEEKEITSKKKATEKAANLSGEIFNAIEEVKLPGLNEVLETYKASHGLNRLKQVMKGRFHYMPREYFMQRPMDKEFLIYSAKDVEDLIEIKDKMEQRLKEILVSFAGEVEAERVDILCKKVSKTYALHGCEHKD